MLKDKKITSKIILIIMIMKNKIITIILVFLGVGALAQQNASFSNYFFNPLYINPAYAGSREFFSGTMVNRSQWVGVEGAPETQSLSIHSKIYKSNVGLGLYAYSDEAGPLKNTGLSAVFAYHIKLGAETNLSFGIAGTLNNIKIEFEKIHIENPNDPSFTNNSSFSLIPDANFGAYLYKDRFYTGISVRHLLQSRIKMQNVQGDNNAKFYRHYFFTSGFVTELNENFSVRPSLMLKYVKAAPMVYEINTSVIYHDKLYIGAGFRTSKRIKISGYDNSVLSTIEYDISRSFRLGYSYDFCINRTGSYTKGSHEIILGWDLGYYKIRKPGPSFF